MAESDFEKAIRDTVAARNNIRPEDVTDETPVGCSGWEFVNILMMHPAVEMVTQGDTDPIVNFKTAKENIQGFCVGS